jgi:hypothetical protein
MKANSISPLTLLPVLAAGSLGGCETVQAAYSAGMLPGTLAILLLGGAVAGAVTLCRNLAMR